MELIKIKGQTYYIPGPTNVGVYSFRNGFCALIDSGADNPAGKRIIEILEKHNLKIKYILHTHNHPDHCAADNYIRSNHTGAVVYAAPLTGIFLEHSQLQPFSFYGASPLKELNGRMIKGRDVKVDFELTIPAVDCGGKKFEVLPLPGHSIDQVGIVTPDKIVFLGDTLFSPEIIEKYSFPFYVNVEEQLNCFSFLREEKFDGYVLGHSQEIYGDAEQLISLNEENLFKHLDTIKELLAEPLSRDDLVEKIVQFYQLAIPDLEQYFITLVSVSAFISYLYNKGEIKGEVLEGKLYFYV
jgi:glyoxylase-like metal-dependent hydrolase (beta-lactamase superfamily II)